MANQEAEPLRLLTAAEVASLLQVPTQAVYRMAEWGELPFVRVGKRRLRFDPAALSAWIQQQKEKEGAAA